MPKGSKPKPRKKTATPSTGVREESLRAKASRKRLKKSEIKNRKHDKDHTMSGKKGTLLGSGGRDGQIGRMVDTKRNTKANPNASVRKSPKKPPTPKKPTKPKKR